MFQQAVHNYSQPVAVHVTLLDDKMKNQAKRSGIRSIDYGELLKLLLKPSATRKQPELFT